MMILVILIRMYHRQRSLSNQRNEKILRFPFNINQRRHELNSKVKSRKFCSTSSMIVSFRNTCVFYFPYFLIQFSPSVRLEIRFRQVFSIYFYFFIVYWHVYQERLRISFLANSTLDFISDFYHQWWRFAMTSLIWTGFHFKIFHCFTER